MKRTTKKLAGRGLELFLRRFFRSQPGIDAATADALTRAGNETFASVRVRAPALARWRPPLRVTPPPRSPRPAETDAPSSPPPQPRQAPAQQSKPATAASSALPAAPPAALAEAATFDPYSIGLVPTFQREGADGLLGKLAAVATADDLRRMARAQQIALPADLRTPDAAPDAIRKAIVAAVEKRIANRRAAAG